MPTLDLDFGDVGKIVPEGVWRVLIKEGTYKANKAKDGFIIEFDAEVMDMPEEYASLEGTKVFPKPNVSLKASARWKLQEVLGAVTQSDWTEDGMQLEVNEDDNTVPIVAGKTVLATFVHEEYNKRVNSKMDTWIPDDGTIEPGEGVTLTFDSPDTTV